MALPKRCFYLRNLSPAELASALEEMARELERILFGKVDGANLSPLLFLSNGGLKWSNPQPGAPPQIYAPALLKSKVTAYLRQKGTKGLEILVNPSDATDGRFCIVDVRDPDEQQLLSFVVDPYTDADPGATIKTPLGILTLDTSGAFDLVFKRNATEGLRLDGTGLLASKQLRWTTGLGAIVNVLGPSDQTLRVFGAEGRGIYISEDEGDAGAKGLTILPSSDGAAFVGADYLYIEKANAAAAAKLDVSGLASTERTFTFPDVSGTFWTSGNDGSGSGLDADTVDGRNPGSASGIATLDSSSKVVEDPANATATPTTGKIPIGGDNGSLASGWLGGQYSARVYDSNATQNIADSTQTAITFDSEEYDNGTLHSTVTNTSRITVTAAGRYLIFGVVSYAANATGIRNAEIWLNGAAKAIASVPAVASEIVRVPVSVSLSLAANDYVEIKAYQTSTGTLAANGGNVYESHLGVARLAGQ